MLLLTFIVNCANILCVSNNRLSVHDREEAESIMTATLDSNKFVSPESVADKLRKISSQKSGVVEAWHIYEMMGHMEARGRLTYQANPSSLEAAFTVAARHVGLSEHQKKNGLGLIRRILASF